MKSKQILAFLASTLLFTACGGGGSGASKAETFLEGDFTPGRCQKFRLTSKDNHLSFHGDTVTKTYYRYYDKRCEPNKAYFKQVVSYDYVIEPSSDPKVEYIYMTVTGVNTVLKTEGQLSHAEPSIGRTYIYRYGAFPDIGKLVVGLDYYSKVK